LTKWVVRIYLTVRVLLTLSVDADMAKKDRGKAETDKTETEEAKTAPAAGGAVPTKTLYCSFCFKSQHEVKRLISGPAAIFICAECIDLCNGIIAGRPLPNAAKATPKELPTERLLERLQAIEETLQGKGNQLQSMVELLRSREVSWAQIGAALGISRQSAWERFT